MIMTLSRPMPERKGLIGYDDHVVRRLVGCVTTHQLQQDQHGYSKMH